MYLGKRIYMKKDIGKNRVKKGATHQGLYSSS